MRTKQGIISQASGMVLKVPVTVVWSVHPQPQLMTAVFGSLQAVITVALLTEC